MTAPLRYTGQRLIAMKGQYPHDELEVLDANHSEQIASVSVDAIDVPFLDAERHAVIVEYR
jgi:16S rRNA G527 N7-methylase RsmG